MSHIIESEFQVFFRQVAFCVQIHLTEHDLPGSVHGKADDLRTMRTYKLGPISTQGLEAVKLASIRERV